jgi:uroporphyrinogen decarboxylase
MTLPAPSTDQAATAEAPQSRFLRACQRLPVDATPVWFMRQAGRYMPEYRAIREKLTLLEICQRPEVAAEVTLQPVQAFGVDAAILFADILLPLIPMGLKLEFVKGEGPLIRNPVRSMADVHHLRPVDPQTDLGHVLQAIRILRSALGETPLIGFCGAPFTVAAYAIEGGATREFIQIKKIMYGAPEIFQAFMTRLTDVLIAYLSAQIQAGAQAVQVFDSWIGALSPQDYQRYVFPHSTRLLKTVEALGTPVIHFGAGTPTLLPWMRQAGGTVLGLDWRIPLDDGWKTVGSDRAIQGNLDPAVLFAPLPELRRQVEDVLRRAGNKPGHIFNTGHGIFQHTPVESVRAVVEIVHELSARLDGSVRNNQQ